MKLNNYKKCVKYMLHTGLTLDMDHMADSIRHRFILYWAKPGGNV